MAKFRKQVFAPPDVLSEPSSLSASRSCARNSRGRGARPHDVAKLLGDTAETIKRHYAPFVRELRECGRRIMETGEGA